MEFCERLDSYVSVLGCTSSELAKASGVSLATISRYRSGERVPSADSPQVVALARGIAALSARRDDVPTLDEDDVLARLSSDASGIPIDNDAFRSNLSTLLATLGYSNSELARALSYDPSYISRIISGSRHPSDVVGFIEQVASFVARRNGTPPRSLAVAQLVGCPPDAVSSPEGCAQMVSLWLSSNEGRSEGSIGDFLHMVDSFDMAEFAHSLDFHDIDLPNMPVHMPATKTYTGARGFMEAEMDFFRATLLSRSQDPIIMYSDVSQSDMGGDPESSSRWFLGLSLLLRRGLHVNIIHDVMRPTSTMMAGLERWIPLYMTGQITPYYLENRHPGVFLHDLRVSGEVALDGRAIAGHLSEGTCVVTREREGVRMCTLQARRLLEYARPLITIFREEDRTDFDLFIREVASSGPRRAILSAPPVQTISDDLLERILEDNCLPEDSREKIRAHVRFCREHFGDFLSDEDFHIELAQFSREEFERCPVSISLSGMFCEEDVTYTYEQYVEHIAMTCDEARIRENLTVDLNSPAVFRNIQVLIGQGKWALVSKAKSPAIHFLVENPQLLAAIEGYAPETKA